MILAIGLVGLIVLVGGLFWLWMKATDGEVGPSLVATAVSLVVIVAALYIAVKLQDRGAEEEGRLMKDVPTYASTPLEMPEGNVA